MNYAKQFLIGLVIIGLLVLPMRVEAQQNEKLNPTPDLPLCGKTGCAPQPNGYNQIPVPVLSKSVLSTAQQKFTTLAAESRSGVVHSTTIAAAATSLQTLFASMTETGYTAKVEAWAKANEGLWTNNDPPTAVLTAGYNSIRAAGIPMTQQQFNQMVLGTPLTAREAFVTELNSIGLEAMHAQIIKALNESAAQARNVEARGGVFVLVAGKVPWATLSGAYFAVAMLSLAVASGGTSAIVFAAIGAGLAGWSLACAC